MEVEKEDYCLISPQFNVYSNIRHVLFDVALYIDNSFLERSDNDKLSFILNNIELVFNGAKVCQ